MNEVDIVAYAYAKIDILCSDFPIYISKLNRQQLDVLRAGNAVAFLGFRIFREFR